MNPSPLGLRPVMRLVWGATIGLIGLGCEPHAKLIPDPEPRPVCEGGSHADVPIGTCDLYRQDCARGEACVAVSLGTDFTTSCEPTFGAGGVGAVCIGVTECDTSLRCINGRCSPVCCPTTDDPCGADGVCVVRENLGDYEVMRCLFADICTPLEDTCAEGYACYPSAAVEEPRCLQPGTGTTDDICDAPNDCEAGHACISFSDGPNRCASLCALAATPDPCPNGRTCQATNNLPSDVGACLP